MLLLFETPAGFSLFKVKDEGKLDDAEVRRPPLPQENFARHRRRLCYLSFVDGWGCARRPARGVRARLGAAGRDHRNRHRMDHAAAVRSFARASRRPTRENPCAN
jgi:hypothetical protein